MSAATPQERMAALLARTPTATLAGALRILKAKSDLTADERLAHARTVEELERRFPEAAAAVERAFDEAEALIEQGVEAEDPDYVGVLLANIPGA